MTYDCVIVGAGPAGASAAIHLARAGRSVALVGAPRPKACGEGLMPWGVDELERLGVHFPGRAFSGVRWFGRELRFPGRPGLSVRRDALDPLLAQAARVAGAELLAPGRSLPKGRRLLIADGLNSPTLRAIGVRRRYARRRVGLSAHVELPAVSDMVEVTSLPGGELYVTPQGERRANVAALLGAPVPFETLLPPSARLLSPVRALGPLGSAAEAWEGEGWLALGDAAGAVDPLIGQGICLALRGGRLAAQAVLGEWRPGAYTRRRLLLTAPPRLLAGAALLFAKIGPWHPISPSTSSRK